MEPSTPTYPPILPPRRRTASSLLAKFLPGASPTHKMDQQRSPVQTNQGLVSTNSAIPSPFTPLSNKQINITDDENAEDMVDEEITFTSGRRSGLRQRRPNTSLKALENTESTPKRSHQKKKSALEGLVGGDLTPMVSQRVAVRQEIAEKTAATRNQFLIEKSEDWLPLLPENNYVRKLLEKHALLSPEEVLALPKISEYEELETQPKGIRAVMKPYQLSGLSFMVYLHRNVSLYGVFLGFRTHTLSHSHCIHTNQ